MRVTGLWQAVFIFSTALVGFCLFWYACFEVCRVTGFESQVTPQYGFTSGIGPMILTGLGMATIITGLWHGHNCHQAGCFRVGRHRVDGTPWCDVHHDLARPEKPVSELIIGNGMILDQILTVLKDRLQ
jgi:hypothetical protein